VGRAAQDLAHGLRRLPRLIDSLHVVAEHERRRVEQETAEPAPAPVRAWPKIGFAEIVAILALAAAIVAWWR